MSIDAPENTHNELCLLEEKINEASELLSRIENQFKTVGGVSKLCNKVKAELRFLNNLKNKECGELKRYLDTSNLLHYKGIVECAEHYQPCAAFCKSFTVPNQKKGLKLEVDLVINDGERWVKVISRNARGLAMEYVANGGSASRSIIEQARCFMTMALNYPHFYKPPEVVFQFLNGVPDLLSERIESCGVIVLGDTVPIGELVILPEDSDSEPGTSDSECEGSYSEDDEILSYEQGNHTLNLDITAIFALISALTHENGANFRFQSSMLNEQAEFERKSPVLPGILRIMEGKKLIMCRTAFNAVNDILRTVAGPEEKTRAELLFKNVEIVEDRLSKRAEALKMSDKINERSKVIFGSGDYYKAVTLTANRHFVNAAAYQGLQFAVILHHSRALSEQKQMTAEPL